MKVDDIKLRISAAEAKLYKTEQTIARLEKQRTNKENELLKLGINPQIVDRNDVRSDDRVYWLYCDYEGKQEQIDNNKAKSEEIKQRIEQLNQQLNTEIAHDEFLKDNIPAIIREFFDTWKDNIYEYALRRYEDYQQLKIELAAKQTAAMREAIRTLPEYERYSDRAEEMSDYELVNARPSKPMRDYLKEQGLDNQSIASKKNAAAGPLVKGMLNYSSAEQRNEWLNKTLEEEKRSRLLALAHRVGKIVGKITDGRHLGIENGEICGIIIGENGAASIRTIGAGGYNIQCYHFRTLVHEVDMQMDNEADNDAQEDDCDMEM